MKILITGGCGFLGSNLASHGISSGYDIIVFDNLSRLGATANLEWLKKQGDFEFVHGDIRNKNDVFRLIKNIKPDVIFHLAGQVAMTTSLANPYMDFEVNVGGTINLLESVRRYNNRAIVVYSSTNKVYGDLEQYSYKELSTRYECSDFPHGFNEQIGLDFHSPYGCSKGAADQYMLDYARLFDMQTVVFRHSSMYGGRQFATADQGWIGWFCQKAVDLKKDEKSLPFTISGNGKQVRDVLHAEDMVRLYYGAIDNINKIAGEVFNIGGGMNNSLSLLELFLLLEQKIDVELLYKNIPVRSSDQKVFVADISKASNLLNWKPIIDSNSGVTKMLEWLQES
ncbi:GDP-mannose 4,6-dehydratase [Agarilytica rhodophyticola]|uniref:GDP-mannose 4,6-dehydratase n=1 Tax=Agarilytica rhodophyticola TaxID=1737490 RepID=UPI000B3443B8|nr:GDP-mannose 4,6-dehydratase [Agarilytica rhodophyticola]